MKKSRTTHTTSASSPVQTAESMAALAGKMADDFNNILTTVMGACSLIDKDDPANGELLQYVALIRASAEHAAELSDRLMQVGAFEQEDTDRSGSRHGERAAATSVRDKKTINDIVPTTNTRDGALA